MHKAPTIFNHPLKISSLLIWILENHTPPTTVVICSDRDTFLRELYLSSVREKEEEREKEVPSGYEFSFDDGMRGTLHREEEEEGGDVEMDDIDAEADFNTKSKSTQSPKKSFTTHPLLARRLSTIFQSQSVNLVFTDTTFKLHAYLSTFSSSTSSPTAAAAAASNHSPNPLVAEGEKMPMLIIINILTLHKEMKTAFSAQGLGKAFAAAVEAGWRSRRKVVLGECGEGGCGMDVESGGGDGGLDEGGMGECGDYREEFEDGREDDLTKELERNGLRRGMDVDKTDDEGLSGHRENVGESGPFTDNNDNDNDSNDEKMADNVLRHEQQKQRESPSSKTPHKTNKQETFENKNKNKQGSSNPWQEETPILNSTAKTIPGIKAKTWLERKVKIANVATRWFFFEDLPGD